MTAHPGAFCGPAGAIDQTAAGTEMVCSVGDKPGRARWRRNGPKPAPRPRKARRARGSAANAPLPSVDAGIDPNAPSKHAVPEAADAQAKAQAEPMTDQEVADKIRAAYADQPDRWMAMKDLAAKTGLTPEEIARGTRELLKDDNFRAEPEPFGHRVQDEDKAASPVIGGEARHKLSFIDRDNFGPGSTTSAQSAAEPTPVPAPEPVRAAEPVREPVEQPKVDGRHTDRDLMPNRWGGTPGEGHHCVHYDGPLPRGVERLGDDARIDMGNGEPLADTVLNLADDVRGGKLHPSELPGKLREVQARLPEGSSAARKVGLMADDVDAPMTPAPALPENTPAPMADLVRELHSIPVCRQRPERELDRVVEMANGVASGSIRTRDVESLLRDVSRHESWSDSGSIQINKAVADTVARLEADRAEARRLRREQQG